MDGDSGAAAAPATAPLDRDEAAARPPGGEEIKGEERAALGEKQEEGTTTLRPMGGAEPKPAPPSRNGGPFSSTVIPRTVDAIAEDHFKRRDAILRAITDGEKKKTRRRREGTERENRWGAIVDFHFGSLSRVEGASLCCCLSRSIGSDRELPCLTAANDKLESLRRAGEERKGERGGFPSNRSGAFFFFFSTSPLLTSSRSLSLFSLSLSLLLNNNNKKTNQNRNEQTKTPSSPPATRPARTSASTASPTARPGPSRRPRTRSRPSCPSPASASTSRATACGAPTGSASSRRTRTPGCAASRGTLARGSTGRAGRRSSRG